MQQRVKEIAPSAGFLALAFGFSLFHTSSPSILLGPIVISLVAFAYFLKKAAKGKWKLPHTVTFVSVTLFWLWTVCSLFWSTTPDVSFYFCFYLSIFPVLFIFFSISPLNSKEIQIYLLGLLGGIAFLAGWALIQYFFFYHTHGPRIHHPMLNPNNLAALFNMGVILGISLFLRGKSRWQKLGRGLLVCFLFAALIVTQSRGGFVSLSVAIVLLVALCARPKREFAKKFLTLVIVLFLVAASINAFHANFHAKNPLLTGLQYDEAIAGREQLTSTASFGVRLSIWKSALQMVADKPFLGRGLGSFSYYYPAYRFPEDRNSAGYFAHMDPLQFAVEMGVISVFLFYLIFLALYLRTTRVLFYCWNDYDLRVQISGLLCAMLVLLLHTHISFHFYIPAVLVFFATLMAAWYKTTVQVLGENALPLTYPLPFLRRLACKTILLVGLTLVVLIPVKISVSTYFFLQAQKAIETGDIGTAENKLQAANIFARKNSQQRYEVEARMLLLFLADNRLLLSKDDIESLRMRIEDLLGHIERINPPYADTYYLRAYLSSLTTPAKKEAVINALEKALKLNPLYLEARLRLAELYKNQGDYSVAAKILHDGNKWPFNIGPEEISYLLAVADVHRLAGDQANYERIMDEVMLRAQQYEEATGKETIYQVAP